MGKLTTGVYGKAPYIGPGGPAGKGTNVPAVGGRAEIIWGGIVAGGGGGIIWGGIEVGGGGGGLGSGDGGYSGGGGG